MLNWLADGADMEAAEAFNDWQPQRGWGKRSIAVLPFAGADYEQAIGDRMRYRELLTRCDDVIPLDNIYAEPE